MELVSWGERERRSDIGKESEEREETCAKEGTAKR